MWLRAFDGVRLHCMGNWPRRFCRSPDSLLLGLVGLSVLLSASWAEIGRSWTRVLERPWHFALSQALQALGAIGITIAGVLGVRQTIRQLQGALRDMWRYGAPLMLVSLAFVILAASDRLLITGILGPAAAGEYSAAFGVASRALGVLLLPIALATKPQVFIAFKLRGAANTRRFLKRVSSWLIAVGLPITTLLVCAPATLTS